MIYVKLAASFGTMEGADSTSKARGSANSFPDLLSRIAAKLAKVRLDPTTNYTIYKFTIKSSRLLRDLKGVL